MKDSTSTDAALQVLSEFTACFNACDLRGMDACLHFPHIILSGAELTVWDAPGVLKLEFFENLRSRFDWSESVYSKRQPLLVAEDKVHFLVAYTRNRADGSIITAHENLWIVTKEGDKWGIKIRSY
jgi:hypothetical protein